MIRRRVVVSGDVQGVAFRDTCRRMATQHQVSGWVRNLPDGTVEAVFEGDPEAVARVVEWTRRGPRAAVVESVDLYEENIEDLVDFEIRATPRLREGG